MNKKKGRISNYKNMLEFLEEEDLSSAENFNALTELMDVENFMDFQIAQIYFDNRDAGGNIKFWRPQTPSGKWRWVLYDTDLGCNKQFLKRNFIRDRTFPVHEYWYNPSYAYTLLNNMLKNEDLKKRFINQYCFLMATHITAKNFNLKLIQNGTVNYQEPIFLIKSISEMV